MKLEQRKPSGREKDEASVKLLAKLREQLYSSNISTIRQSAFNLSWMQEDGLDILKEALLKDTPRRVKGAAAYGLRKMRGRMRKVAEGVLVEGLGHPYPSTAETCRNALIVLKRGKSAARRPMRPRRKPSGGNFEIREISDKTRQTRQPQRERDRERRRPDDRPSRRRGPG
jgi:hypothetical protein